MLRLLLEGFLLTLITLSLASLASGQTYGTHSSFFRLFSFFFLSFLLIADHVVMSDPSPTAGAPAAGHAALSDAMAHILGKAVAAPVPVLARAGRVAEDTTAEERALAKQRVRWAMGAMVLCPGRAAF